MKLLPVISAALIATGTLFSLNAQSVTTDPVGYVTTTFFGDRDTTFAPGLTRPGVFRGSISSTPNLSSVTFIDQNWSADEFADSHFVLVRSGELEGAFAKISANTADTLTLEYISEDFLLGSAEGVNAGDSVEIIPFWTLGEVFSDDTPNGARVLLYSRNSVGEDLAASSAYTYFDGFGWFDGPTPGNNTIIYPDESIIFRNLSGVDFINVVAGQVRMTNLRVRLEILDPSRNQDFRIPTFTVANRTISQVFDSANISQGDRLLIFNDNESGVDKSSAISATFFDGFGWFDGPTDMNNYELPVNAGLVLRKSKDGSLISSILINSDIN